MPDMPMPPIPTKWIVPRSVPKAFIIEGVSNKDWPSSRGHASGEGGADTRSQSRADQNRGEPVANALDEVGEIARGVRPTDRKRSRSGIVERNRIGGHGLDLPSQDFGREAFLLDRARTTCVGHLARVGGLMIVGRGGERDQDCRSARGGQLGDR